MPIKFYSTGCSYDYLRAIGSAPSSIKTVMSDNDMPKNWQPTTADYKVTFPQKKKTTNAYADPRVCLRAEPLVSPFSKEGLERNKQKARKEAEAQR